MIYSPAFPVFFFMAAKMRRLRQKFKIFYSIIRKISVYVMDYFGRFKMASDLFFHYKTMLHNVTFFICKRMAWIENLKIAIPLSKSSFPHRIISSVLFYPCSRKFRKTKSGTCRRFNLFEMAWFHLYIFFTYRALSKHVHHTNPPGRGSQYV